MTTIKSWVQVVLALALGFGLGLLSHQVRAANVEAEPTNWIAYGLCTETGGEHSACLMQHSTPREAMRIAELVLFHCKVGLTKGCAVTLPYIRQRWGY